MRDFIRFRHPITMLRRARRRDERRKWICAVSWAVSVMYFVANLLGTACEAKFQL